MSTKARLGFTAKPLRTEDEQFYIDYLIMIQKNCICPQTGLIREKTSETRQRKYSYYSASKLKRIFQELFEIKVRKPGDRSFDTLLLKAKTILAQILKVPGSQEKYRKKKNIQQYLQNKCNDSSLDNLEVDKKFITKVFQYASSNLSSDTNKSPWPRKFSQIFLTFQVIRQFYKLKNEYSSKETEKNQHHSSTNMPIEKIFMEEKPMRKIPQMSIEVSQHDNSLDFFDYRLPLLVNQESQGIQRLKDREIMMSAQSCDDIFRLSGIDIKYSQEISP